MLVKPSQRLSGTGCLLVLYCCAANLACWSASLLQAFDSPLVVWTLLTAYLTALFVIFGIRPWPSSLRWRVPVLKKRFSRLLPACFLVLYCAIALGAILYQPSNYDHLAYRFPRLLNWWAEGHWHWIETPNLRMNLSGIGYEFSWYPFFLIFKSDWAAVALNLIAFALLPGAIYQVLRGLGVGDRISYFWMWVLPSGYGFVTQAGSAGNDAFGALIFLTAMSLAIHAVKGTGCQAAAFLMCILATAFLTGLKLSNAPLALPVAVLLLSRARDLLTTVDKARVAAAIVLGLAVSALPVLVLNTVHSGSWTGDPENHYGASIESPAAGIVANTLQTAVRIASPPIIPFARVWNRTWPEILPQNLHDWLAAAYPVFRLDLREIPGEEGGSLGFGIVLAAGILWFLARRHGWFKLRKTISDRIGIVLVLLGGWLAYFVFLAKMGSVSVARLGMPYYPLLLASLFAFRSLPYRRCIYWCRVLGVFSMLCALVVIVLSVSRPLFPWRLTFTHLPLGSELKQRAIESYEVYSNRADAFSTLRRQMPGNMSKIGLVTSGDDAEVSLWRPFGERQVVHLWDGMATSREIDLDAMVVPVYDTVSYRAALARLGIDPANLEILASAEIQLKARGGAREWLLLGNSSGDQP